MADAIKEKISCCYLSPLGYVFICIMKEQPRNTRHFKKSKNVKEDPDNAIEQLDLISVMKDPFAIKKKELKIISIKRACKLIKCL